jgi:pSer/pThr/pTyr-binding forkhead associated (FHA) protein
LKLVAVRTLRQNDALYRGIDDSSAHPSTLRLINYNEELDIEIHSGDTVGRTAGRHAQIFQRFDNVSSEHLIFDYDRQAGWRAIDLGSTNGTYYQGSRLRSHVPQALANGQIIQIGNVQFLLRITTASSQ